MEKRGTENASTAAIVSPRNDDAERNEDEHSGSKICLKGRARRWP